MEEEKKFNLKNPDGDKETQEILDEMRSAKGDEPEKKPEGKEKEVKKEEIKEDKKEEEEVKEKIDRPIRAMPLSKYKKQKEKWENTISDLNDKIAELKEQSKPKEVIDEKVDDVIKDFSEKHSLDADVIAGLSKIISKKVSIPKETLDKIDKIVNSNNEQYQDNMFNNEFNKVSEKYEDAKDFKEDIKELAFTEEFSKSPLEAIYLYAKSQKVKGKKSVEGSSPKNQKNKFKNFDEVEDSPEAIANMTDKEFDAFSETMAKKSGSNLKIERMRISR